MRKRAESPSEIAQTKNAAAQCGLHDLINPSYSQHVWGTDFMQAKSLNGAPFWILNVIDECTRECMASKVGRPLTHHNVLDVLTKLFIQKDVAAYIHSDNGPESPPSEYGGGCRNCKSNH